VAAQFSKGLRADLPVTWSDIIYRAGNTLTVFFGLYALWCFLGVLWGLSLDPWVLVPPGMTEKELIGRLTAQRKWAGVEATVVAAVCYAVTRSVLYLLAWFNGDIST
jgi:hypothetical protein